MYKTSHKGKKSKEKEKTLLDKALAPFLWQDPPILNDPLAPHPRAELSTGSHRVRNAKDFPVDHVPALNPMTQRRSRLPNGNYSNVAGQRDQRDYDDNILNSQQQYQSRQFLTDDDILRLLPSGTDGASKGYAVTLKECKYRKCGAVAPAGCQGYCAKHFCRLYREHLIDIEPKNDMQNSKEPNYAKQQFETPKRDITGYGYDESPMRMRYEIFPESDNDDVYIQRHRSESLSPRKIRSKQRTSQSKYDARGGSLHPPETRSKPERRSTSRPESQNRKYRNDENISEYPHPRSHRDSKHDKRAIKDRNDVIESGYSSSDSENKPRKPKPSKSNAKPKRCPGPMCYAATTSSLCKECEELLNRCYETEQRSREIQRLSKKRCVGPDCDNYGSSSLNGLCNSCYTILKSAKCSKMPMPACEAY